MAGDKRKNDRQLDGLAFYAALGGIPRGVTNNTRCIYIRDLNQRLTVIPAGENVMTQKAHLYHVHVLDAQCRASLATEQRGQLARPV